MAQVKVQTGDTVSDIAKRFNVPNAAVSGFRSRDPNTIFPEEVLEVDETQRIQPLTPEGAIAPAVEVAQPIQEPIQAPEEPTAAGLPEGQFRTPSGAVVDEAGNIVSGPEAPSPEDEFFGQFGIAPEAIEQGFQTNPFGTLSDIVGQVMEATGLPSFRADITSTANQIEEIENQRDREVEQVQDNPFVSAGSKQQRIEKIRDKFDKRINARVNKLTLLQSQQNQARQQAQFAATTAINLFGKQQQFQQDQIDRVLDERERVLEAEADTAPLETESVGGFTVLRNPITGKIVSTQKPQTVAAGDVNNPLKLSNAQINKGMVASGDTTREQFLNRPVEEQQGFSLGSQSKLVGGRVSPEVLTATKADLTAQADEGKSRDELEALIENIPNLPPADELELRILLDELAPIGQGFFSRVGGGAKGVAKGIAEIF